MKMKPIICLRQLLVLRLESGRVISEGKIKRLLRGLTTDDRRLPCVDAIDETLQFHLQRLNLPQSQNRLPHNALAAKFADDGRYLLLTPSFAAKDFFSRWSFPSSPSHAMR